MSSGFLRILYLSKATYAIDHEELIGMTQRFSARNISLDVTGTMLRIGNYYAQVIEGPAEAVDSLFAKIKDDQRHDGVTILARYFDGARVFGDWGMTYVDMDSRYYVNLGAAAELRSQIAESLTLSSSRSKAMLATLARIQRHIRSQAALGTVKVNG